MRISDSSNPLPASLNKSPSNSSTANSAFAQLLAATTSAQENNSGSIAGLPSEVTNGTTGANVEPTSITKSNDDLRDAFTDFIGQTFFSELIKSYRSTQQPAAYFNGGRAEKIFQGQLDQMFAEELSEHSADKVAAPMFEQFQIRRNQ